MKKNFFTTTVFMFFLLVASFCFAQGTYVRKKIQPSFYIPESALDKPEKLPEFQIPKLQPQKFISIPIPEEAEEPEDTAIEEIEVAPIASLPVALKKTEKKQILPNNKYAQLILEKLSLEPADFQKRFNIYQEDIKLLSETGNLPKNEQLERELSFMNSADRTSLQNLFSQN
ncbi:MAG: hypothetical protein PHE89_07120 [Alphaproteobacteria bacterium]|nr:hypothetical protein [Alphaproteobacteria bacterium]